MSDKDTQKAEQILEQSSEERRHNTEPDHPDDTADASISLREAVKEEYERIDDGDKPENVTLRDKNLVALLDGLTTVGELEELVEDARDKLGRDGGEVTRSEAVRVLVRVGIAEIAPNAAAEATEARKEHESEDIQF